MELSPKIFQEALAVLTHQDYRTNAPQIIQKFWETPAKKKDPRVNIFHEDIKDHGAIEFFYSSDWEFCFEVLEMISEPIIPSLGRAIILPLVKDMSYTLCIYAEADAIHMAMSNLNKNGCTFMVRFIYNQILADRLGVRTKGDAFLVDPKRNDLINSMLGNLTIKGPALSISLDSQTLISEIIEKKIESFNLDPDTYKKICKAFEISDPDRWHVSFNWYNKMRVLEFILSFHYKRSAILGDKYMAQEALLFADRSKDIDLISLSYNFKY